MSNLDHRSPLVLDTRELGRRAGSMKAYEFTVAAPADLGLPWITVPAGSDIDFDLRLESVSEGVLVTGTAIVSVAGECGRCLEPLAYDTEVDFQKLYKYPATDARGRKVSDDEDDEDEDILTLDDDLLDLEPVVRDEVVSALPQKPLCQPDCRGLCTQCGANLNDEPEHQHEVVDPRWSALQNLATKDSSDDDSDR